MADYREIKGLKVPYLDSDLPSASASTQAGGVWYNSITGKLRAFLAADTWATSADMTNARAGCAMALAAAQTASLVFGGFDADGDEGTAEEYNGSGWAAGGSLNSPRGQLMGCGIQTAALAIGGEKVDSPAGNKDLVEQYDGSSWTEIADLNLTRRAGGAAGTTTAGLAFAGLNPPSTPPNRNESEEWNGTSWTEGNNLNTARYSVSGAGTQTAALCVAGTPSTAIVELYDGTSWTEVGDLNTGRQTQVQSGISTDSLVFAGPILQLYVRDLMVHHGQKQLI